MPENYIEKLELTNFTAFDHIELGFAPGVNVLIGTNGTGKTHTLKVLYACLSAERSTGAEEIPDRVFIEQSIERAFLISNRDDGVFELVRRGNTESKIGIHLEVGGRTLELYSALGNKVLKSKDFNTGFFREETNEIIYIPPKEILTHSPGFLALYDQRHIYFEEIYKDILLKAQLPQLKKPFDKKHGKMLDDLNGLLTEIESEIGGKVVNENDAFYVQDEYGKLEFSLLAEGYSKLGLLWQLIRNGSLAPGATLFWDEPETNLNPELMKIVAKTLMVLQRHNIQVFLATHSYIMLKEIDLAAGETDSVKFHRLYKKEGAIKVQTADEYLGIVPNVINDTYLDAYERELDRDERLNDRKENEE